MKTIRINCKIQPEGFDVVTNNQTLRMRYPDRFWSAVPLSHRELLAQTITYFVTKHLALSKKSNILYNFPPPPDRLFVDYGFYYSMAEAPFEFPTKNLTTEGVLQSVYNTEFSINFNDIPKPTVIQKPLSMRQDSMVMPMSFGKDSLLTFAISRELELRVHPIFSVEPACPNQNVKKMQLYDKFRKEFTSDISPMKNTLGLLREPSGMMWGWDMLLTQYTTMLLPYVFKHQAKYFFWSNELSTNEYAKNKEGYIINPTHEQGVSWMLHLNNLYRRFGVNTIIGSLLEPIHELAILHILHRRYPEVGKYQLSCDGENTYGPRWCGKCNECARLYLFYSALGIDPKRVNLQENMFQKKYIDLFYLFEKTNGSSQLDTLFQSYGERLTAFYLAYRRGTKGYVIDQFVEKLLPYVLKHKKQLIDKYLTVHQMSTLPDEISEKVLVIYRSELSELRKTI